MTDVTEETPFDPTAKRSLPVLPLRDIVVFPQMIVPLFVGRDKSVAALESAMLGDKTVFLLSPKTCMMSAPSPRCCSC
jgi:ATP-dependent Lon protease